MIYLQKLIQGKFFWPFALGLHLVVLGLLYFKFGISFTNESEKYINAARELNFENFNTTLEYLWPYSTYILFLAVGMKLGISLYVMLFIQYVFCLCGFYFFYKFILSQSFFSKTYARICLLIILTCPLIIYWQLTFYTESFFV